MNHLHHTKHVTWAFSPCGLPVRKEVLPAQPGKHVMVLKHRLLKGTSDFCYSSPVFSHKASLEEGMSVPLASLRCVHVVRALGRGLCSCQPGQRSTGTCVTPRLLSGMVSVASKLTTSFISIWEMADRKQDPCMLHFCWGWWQKHLGLRGIRES